VAIMDRPTSITIPAKPEYVSVARLVVAACADLLGFDGDAVEDIKIAVSEACTNAILQLHREARTEERVVTLSVYATEQSLVIEVVFIAREPSGIEHAQRQLRERDLGMSILTSIMDKVEISRAREDGVTIKLAKDIPVEYPK